MENWRWVDAEDGSHILLAGPGPMPVPRVVLTCGNIDSADQDLIAAAPDLMAACEEVVRWIEEDTLIELEELSDDCADVLELIRAALLHARGGTP